MELGEGPVWNASTGTLTVVDIFGRSVHHLRPTPAGWNVEKTTKTGSDVGAAMILNSGELLTCEQAGVFLHDQSGIHRVAELPQAGDSFRANDAKLGPDSRLFVGVMDYEATPGAGSLWAITRTGESALLLDDLCIPNGMDWWGDEFWFVNGPTPEIRCYQMRDDRLVDTGRFVSTQGIPDGLSIDSDGNIWLALWDEGRVDCLSRDGVTLRSISLPAPRTTSVAFVGENYNELAVTTARFGLSDEELEEFPHSGDVFFHPLEGTGSASCDSFGAGA
jgi:sugar lactone lactonase YvrE